MGESVKISCENGVLKRPLFYMALIDGDIRLQYLKEGEYVDDISLLNACLELCEVEDCRDVQRGLRDVADKL